MIWVVLALTVADDEGVTYTTSAVVSNVAPSIDPLSVASPINEGDSTTPGVSFSDPDSNNATSTATGSISEAYTYDQDEGISVTDSAFEEILLKEKRLINEKKYRDSVGENKSLNQHLEYGLFTRNTSLIKNISTQIWEDESVYTEDPIYDYIVKARDWVFHEIEYPYSTYPALLWKQVDAQTTLTTRVKPYHTKPKGYCDEKDIVFKSFMLQKNIPTQIRVLEKTDEFGNMYRHSALLVWWNNTWIKVDPSKYAKVGQWGAGWEKEGVDDITEKAPLDAVYMISSEKW